MSTCRTRSQTQSRMCSMHAKDLSAARYMEQHVDMALSVKRGVQYRTPDTTVLVVYATNTLVLGEEPHTLYVRISLHKYIYIYI